MALSKDVVIRLLGDSASAQKAIKAAADAAEVSVGQYKRAEREYAKLNKAAELAAKQQLEAMDRVGRGAMVFGAVVAAGLALSVKAAVDWETAWAGVVKTVDGTPEQMAELEQSLRQLATTLPATHQEIAAVAEAAGQLGIARGDIVEFTKVAIALGVSTNLSADEAATGLARLSNIMGTSASDVDRLGSVLVGLGNAGASTEAEILAMGLRIAAAGRQAQMTEADVLGIANALSSMGVEAEAGGTAISTVIKKINNAVLDGSEELDVYARLAGQSAEQFAKSWREDAAGALVAVAGGLGALQESGGNVNTVLADLALNDIRVADTMLRLSGNSELLGDSLDTGNKAWAENNALMNEANKRYETTASRVAMARNTLNDAAITVGDTLLPVVASGVDIVADLARGFSELPGWMQDSVAVLGAVTAGIALLGGGAAVATPKILAFRTTMDTLTQSSHGSVAAVGKFGKFMTGPWGLAIGVAGIALGGLIGILGASSKASQEAADYQRDLTAALRESKGVIDGNVRAMAAAEAASDEWSVDGRDLLQWAQELGIELPTVTDALLGNADAYDEIVAAAQRRIDQIEAELDAGGQNAVAKYNQLTAEKNQLQDVISNYGELANSMGGAVAENERLAAAQAESGDAAEGAAGQIDGAAGATGAFGDEAKIAAEAAEELAKALDILNGPTLDLRDAQRQWLETLDAISASIEENGRTLDVNTEAGRNNAEALDAVARAAMDQAEAVYNTTGSYSSFRNSLDAARQQLFETAMQFYDNEDAAWAYVDSVLAIPDEAMLDLDIPAYGQTMDELRDVHGAIVGLPPNTWVNVGALTAQAISALEAVGIKTRTLPDGTVEVMTDTEEAKAQLDAFIIAASRRKITIEAGVHVSNSAAYFGGGLVPERAEGGPIWPGQPFLVGERGPELVQFGASGFVTPAAATAHALAATRGVATAAPGTPAAAGSGIATGSYVEAVRAMATGGPAPIDYGRLAAAVAEGRALVHVDHMEVAREETAQETAERLNWMATTKG